ncbi:MAG: HTTM domain-containing protein [Gammaproteobacteria bacterium]|nr:MAG: HTTM domain-containing protein [Gammaproteobacteria bacterium]
MLLDQAVRCSEIILAFALVQQGLEYCRGMQPEKTLGFVSVCLSVLLLLGFYPAIIECALLVLTGILLYRFQGPYNGGSDCMTALVLLCLFLSHVAPTTFWQEIALGYLAFQLCFSYFQSGYIKVINRDWRNGQALKDVFSITAYPVSELTRRFGQLPRIMLVMSWLVILFELVFPLSLSSQISLILALIVAGLFHLANACLLGLNRFFWIWLSAYPILIWFQNRLFN